MIPRLIDAIKSLAGNDTAFEIENEKIVSWDTGEVKSNVVQPTEEELATELARLQAEYDAQAYARNRKEEYPSIEECVHAILDDDLAALQVKRQAVKDKYPK